MVRGSERPVPSAWAEPSLVKFWQRTPSASSAKLDSPMDWSVMPDAALWTAAQMGLAHCGWSMEQYQATADAVFLDEAELGLVQTFGALDEKRRRIS